MPSSHILTIFTTTLILLNLTTAQISLSQFQPAVDFSSGCLDAYDTPIRGCGPSDFASPNSCSSICLRALSYVQGFIQDACVGQQADPNSVIGQFFQGTGPLFLCSGGSQGGTSTATSVTDMSAGSASSSSSSSSTTDSTTTPAPTSKKHTSVPHTTTDTSSGTTPPATKSFLTTAVYNGQATVLTSQSERTGSSNPDAFGGGGSPFEVSGGVRQFDPLKRVGWLLGLVGMGTLLLVVR